MSLSRAYNIADLRRLARRRLPAPIFHYIDGGADDERTLDRNSAAFAEFEILPRVLVDISAVRTETTIFGRPAAWPLLLSPTGLTRMFHEGAEPAVARAAAKHGLPYALSTMGTTTIEALAGASDAPKAFQIYIFKDRGLTREFVARSKASNVDALILTVDTPIAGNRERDRRTGLSLPPRLTLASLLSFAAHPAWSLPALTGSKFAIANVAHRTHALSSGAMSLFDYINSQFDPALNWSDVEGLAADWGGPLLIKGLMTPEDARRAADSGATGVMLSNHGGRQLDGAPAPIDQVAATADAVGGTMEIICDGGVRRGSDVVKALALGATACSIGRPYLYGLAAGGEAGVDHALTLLGEEFRRTLKLAGLNDIAQLTRERVRRVPSPPSVRRDRPGPDERI